MNARESDFEKGLRLEAEEIQRKQKADVNQGILRMAFDNHIVSSALTEMHKGSLDYIAALEWMVLHMGRETLELKKQLLEINSKSKTCHYGIKYDTGDDMDQHKGD